MAGFEVITEDFGTPVQLAKLVPYSEPACARWMRDRLPRSGLALHLSVEAQTRAEPSFSN